MSANGWMVHHEFRWEPIVGEPPFTHGLVDPLLLLSFSLVSSAAWKPSWPVRRWQLRKSRQFSGAPCFLYTLITELLRQGRLDQWMESTNKPSGLRIRRRASQGRNASPSSWHTAGTERCCFLCQQSIAAEQQVWVVNSRSRPERYTVSHMKRSR